MQISGSKLQENFEYLDKSLPAGQAGDMLYHDGNNWVRLASPGSNTDGHVWILTFFTGLIFPGWVEYKEITVSICEAGTPTEYTILGLPTV